MDFKNKSKYLNNKNRELRCKNIEGNQSIEFIKSKSITASAHNSPINSKLQSILLRKDLNNFDFNFKKKPRKSKSLENKASEKIGIFYDLPGNDFDLENLKPFNQDNNVNKLAGRSLTKLRSVFTKEIEEAHNKYSSDYLVESNQKHESKFYNLERELKEVIKKNAHIKLKNYQIDLYVQNLEKIVKQYFIKNIKEIEAEEGSIIKIDNREDEECEGPIEDLTNQINKIIQLSLKISHRNFKNRLRPISESILSDRPIGFEFDKIVEEEVLINLGRYVWNS